VHGDYVLKKHTYGSKTPFFPAVSSRLPGRTDGITVDLESHHGNLDPSRRASMDPNRIVFELQDKIGIKKRPLPPPPVMRKLMRKNERILLRKEAYGGAIKKRSEPAEKSQSDNQHHPDSA
jgi:hypothetical protein